MPTATMTSKGQITVPQSVRAALGLHAGTKVDFVQVADGYKVVALQAGTTSLKGRFAGRASKPVSIEQMDEAIAAETAARHGRVKRKS
ncbi:AbrB/MazE/SpoVT family DNA-binding domain-containing protein [Caenimonas koreensis DSM 17982]|uniref:AbrB/MazE/SpoVT family DNA-binding domain-containing protein n=1 Tax=Caenimonas koreensis DSM 17982 TaxID=1121255 RepID=A0A844AWY7_9BURK|nr:AbrB/MazE/SpoVT family DNA-binding domain-containing protein [Caenimonas koreensis]MRD46878.1 AbrB/MazE/SpoVT family DNA-binding domain-containing protein [Caenimonas koreensis DSM 17982]